jgi:hypothetical protein
MKLNLICHFYNEEFLLPWWLDHHVKIFDKIIMINYNSTDKSVEIIKNYSQNIEVMNSRNEYFDARACDQEVMDVESSLDGIKVCLNATEFLLAKKEKILEKFKNPHEQSCYAIPRISMVDENPSIKVCGGDCLLSVKNYGFEVKKVSLYGNLPYRYIHNYVNGNYHLGRHGTNLSVVDENFCIFQYKYSPWQQEFIKRKLQIKDKMSDSDKKTGAGGQHLFTLEQMESEMKSGIPFCKHYNYLEIMSN